MFGVSKLGVPHEGDGKVSISTTTGFCMFQLNKTDKIRFTQKFLKVHILDMFRREALYHQQ